MFEQIANTDYITITDNNVMVGGKPTTTYRGEDIWYIKSLPNMFKQIQDIVATELRVSPIEMHVLSSYTRGVYSCDSYRRHSRPGNPAPEHGRHPWVRLVFANDIQTQWVCYDWFDNEEFIPEATCARNCATSGAHYWCDRILGNSDLRSDVLWSVRDKIKPRDIKNTDYITITDNNVMVGGKPTTTYRGMVILNIGKLSSRFKEICGVVKQEYGIAPIEIHALSSGTPGQYEKPDTPSPEHGRHGWTRVVFANNIKTPWMFDGSYYSASDCAFYCASNSLGRIEIQPKFRSRLYDSVADAIKQKNAMVNPIHVNQSGDIAKIATDFDKQKSQLQTNANMVTKPNSK